MTHTQLRRSESRLLSVETPTALGHTSTVIVLDAAKAERPVNGALLTAEVQARLDDLPILRRALVEVPLGLDRAWWRDDPAFDLDYHLRWIAVPDAHDPAALSDLVARIHGRPLDRRRPLWELYLISGLEGGRAALLSKVHLAAVGAADGHELSAGLVGTTPDLASDWYQPGRWRPRPGPGWTDIAGRAWWNFMTDPVRAAGMLPLRLLNVPGFRGVVSPALALLDQRAQRSIVIPSEEGMPPRTSFNRRVGPHRRWAPAVIDMDRVAAVRERHGVSTVDVVATICGGALRWWLLQHDELPKESLQALVPLSVTAPDAIDGLAGVVIDLQTQLHQPEDRLRRVHQAIGAAVREHGAMPAADIRGLGGGTPLVGIIASRFLERAPLADRLQPPFNTVITSVPGPDEPTYALGAPVEAVHPVLGVVDGVGLHIGAMSVDRQLCLSLVSDRDLVPDLDALAARLVVELETLEALPPRA